MSHARGGANQEYQDVLLALLLDSYISCMVVCLKTCAVTARACAAVLSAGTHGIPRCLLEAPERCV
jgi:hypothetical protein